MHGGLALAFIASNTVQGGKHWTGAAGAAPPLALRLLPAGRAGLAAAAKAPEPSAPVPAAPAAPTPPPPEAHPGPTGIRFFTSRELTDPPLMLGRLPGGKLLVVPGVAAQMATVTLAIDEFGNVVGVDFEQDTLSDEERPLVVAELSKLKFQPGKIGHIIVHSKTTLGIRIESTLGT